MAARTTSVAFEGAEARLVDVQVQVAGGSQPIFSIVGLGDKAVTESRERVRARRRWAVRGGLALDSILVVHDNSLASSVIVLLLR